MSWYPQYIAAKMEKAIQTIENQTKALKQFREWLTEFQAASDTENVYKLKRGIKDLAHELGEDCGFEKCQTCCPHSDSRDHGICIDCGHEEDPGAAIDRAMDYEEDR